MKIRKIAIAALCCLYSCNIFADISVGGLTYSVSGTEATITGYTSDMPANLVIPEKINYGGNQYTVTCIGNRRYGSSSWAMTGAFYNCTKLESIVIPSTVTSIKGTISYNYICNHPDYSPDLDGIVFYGCYNLRSIEFQGDIAIGDAAFYNNYNLRIIRFKGNPQIGRRAFWKCTSLTYLVLPNGTTVGSEAFKDCNMIQDVICLGDNNVNNWSSNINN